ncbi:hypothetical protein BN433_0073 [Erwinia amylovora Ea266]|nr:hypothetical protein BN433_0073 [Erwinia amylovora Ea266]
MKNQFFDTFKTLPYDIFRKKHIYIPLKKKLS